MDIYIYARFRGPRLPSHAYNKIKIFVRFLHLAWDKGIHNLDVFIVQVAVIHDSKTRYYCCRQKIVTTTTSITTNIIPAAAVSSLNKFQYFSSLWSRQIHVDL
jgi:hypothetical protein